MTPRWLRHLLRVDCGGGLGVGLAVLVLNGWLASLYDMPRAVIITIGIANIGYGTFSLSLARRAVRPRALIATLAIANGAWAALCAVGVAYFAGHASPLGLLHLGAESAWVGSLGTLEWRYRTALARGA